MLHKFRERAALLLAPWLKPAPAVTLHSAYLSPLILYPQPTPNLPTLTTYTAPATSPPAQWVNV